VIDGAHAGAMVATAAAVAVAVPAARRWPVAVSRALAAIIAGTYLVEHAWFIARGTWSLDFNLPLHLTDVVTVVSVLALWTARPLLVELTWFWALTASLQAVLTPDLGSADFPELLYWTFFITHSGAVVAALVLVIGRRIDPRPGAVRRVFGATLVVAAAAGTANLLTGGNYMWLRAKPDEASLLDVMGSWPWYILSAAVLALALFGLLDMPFRRRRHTPMMPADRAEKLRAWQDAGYRPGRDPDRITRFDYLGRVLEIPETVQPIFPVSHVLGECVLEEVRETDRVLDMGTGSGVNAILAASKAREVVAVDVNPDAVRAARHNAELNAVEVDVFESDVFSRVDGVFDLIVFDPPFRWFAPRDMAERATTDEGYRALTAFFDHVHAYLSANGRLLVFFGSSGDIDYLHHLIDAAGFAAEELRSLGGDKDGEPVTYWTFRLRPRSARR
jgi:release factor glutamine methyltransferase